MDTKLSIILIIVIILIFSGCIGNKTQYVCPNGQIVSSPEKCPRTTFPTTVTSRQITTTIITSASITTTTTFSIVKMTNLVENVSISTEPDTYTVFILGNGLVINGSKCLQNLLDINVLWDNALVTCSTRNVEIRNKTLGASIDTGCSTSKAVYDAYNNSMICKHTIKYGGEEIDLYNYESGQMDIGECKSINTGARDIYVCYKKNFSQGYMEIKRVNFGIDNILMGPILTINFSK